MHEPVTDKKIADLIGNLLRAGVLIAAAVVVLGGSVYLLRSGSADLSYRIFHEAPAPMRHVGGIVSTALSFDGPALIQLGLLLLIAIPVVRVLLSMIAFGLEKDTQYVVITLIVLIFLVLSLTGRTS